MKKNTASQVIGAQMVSATDGSAFTGTVTVYVTGDGGAQALGSVGSGVCTHEGNGFHTYLPATAETNYDHIGFTFIGTGAIPSTVQLYTEFPQTGDAFARLGAPAGASTAADIAAVKVDTAAVKVKTDFLPSATAGAAGGVFIAGTNAATTITTALTTTFTGNLTGSVASVTALAADSVTASALATDAVNEIADGLLGRNVSGGSSTGRTVKQALHFLRNKWSIAGGTLTVTDTDDTTASWTATVSTTAGNPVSTVDPA